MNRILVFLGVSFFVAFWLADQVALWYTALIVAALIGLLLYFLGRQLGLPRAHRALLPSLETTRFYFIHVGCAAALVVNLAQASSFPYWYTAAVTMLIAAVAAWNYRTRRHTGTSFLGPVFYYDVVRSARSGPVYALRFLYVAIILYFLFAGLYPVLEGYGSTRALLNSRPSRTFITDHTQVVFLNLMTLQMIAVLLVAPALSAGAITEEKENKTLEYLLATDLSNREIILSKFCSRIGRGVLLLITPLPVLSFLQFLGGIDPNLLLASFGFAIVTLISVSAIGILCSALLRRSRDSISITYVFVFLFFSVPGLRFLEAKTRTNLLPSSLNRQTQSTAHDWSDLFDRLGQIELAANRGELGKVLPTLLLQYAAFHICVAALAILFAILLLRTLALWESAPARSSLVWPRPSWRFLLRWPVLWKELRSASKLHWLIQVFLFVLIFYSIVQPNLWLIWRRVMNPGLYRSLDPFGSLRWCGYMGTLAACLSFLAVAIQAAKCFASEFRQRTWDDLLTTRLTGRQIALGKFWGCLLSTWGLWLWMGLFYFPYFYLAPISPAALPRLIGAWFLFASFFTILGMYNSIKYRNATKAIVVTIVQGVFAGGGHWIFWYSLGCLNSFWDYQAYPVPRMGTGLFGLVIHGLTIPRNMILIVGADEVGGGQVFRWLGMVFWLLFDWILWYFFFIPRFRAASNRKNLHV